MGAILPRHVLAILKRASASRLSGEWNDDDFDVLADGAVVGRIFKVHAAPVGTPWMWTLAFGHHGGIARRQKAMLRHGDGGVRQELAAEVVQLMPKPEVEAPP